MIWPKRLFHGVFVQVTHLFYFLLVIIVMLCKERFFHIIAPVEECCFKYFINSTCCLMSLFQMTFLVV